ncbi:hypothetical protein [Enterococcus rivorum]|uniref:Uncharacterized protein n=1 Tax=Enterococcus rivorum TaxID=762845 RepID=A0A1E5KWJ8_9ENTE|nr:hypothetical protein [Enterococcus rivorum]MBP2100061.1 hypothetical protein [Enterococcus rivorum]OEH82254.1 hypothetical protein BCR26_13930 [Enterococcus rivorum]
MKKTFVDAKDDLMGSLNKQKRLGAIIIGGAVLLLLSLIIIVPRVQANIRNSQIQSLVNENIDSKKVTVLEYRTMDKVIADQKGITVLFSQPNVKQYTKVMDILKKPDKLAEFNRGIYIYPIVYNVQAVETKYSIVATEPTIVFFENGKEKNRLVLTKDLDLNTVFIPEFNRLPSGGQAETPVVTPPLTSTIQSSEAVQETGVSTEQEGIPSESPQ